MVSANHSAINNFKEKKLLIYYLLIKWEIIDFSL